MKVKVKYKNILKALVLASFFSIFSFGYSDDKSIENAQWGYVGAEGPVHWGNLSEKYKECAIGKQQSPINIVTTKAVKGNESDKVKIDYHLHVKSILNNGHTIQILFKPGSYIFIGKQKYELKQMHFHTPSENYVDGKEYPFEAHFVNISKDGKIAVLALLYQYSNTKTNPFINKIWSHIPKKVGETNIFGFTVNKNDSPLPNGHHSFYEYIGSLTTPPCIEAVKWIILKRKAKISKKQVQTFRNILTFNNDRPIQKANNRKISFEQE
ncbi:carbonate dehydratase [Francisella halioticida]|uniref:Carbonic anhydrase n=1 Tax=Francisella halioticida TaxID=549298 RepID=A0ABM6LZL0_9GAMM|nr:carbonate dehydratase [Francisella halioticida]